MILPVFTIYIYENVIFSFIFYVLCDIFDFMLRIRNKLNWIQMP
jgi:hypothetical protein